MASITAGFGNTGGGGESQAGYVGDTAYRLLSPTQIPELAALAQRAEAAVPTSLPSLQNIISGGVQSPLLEAVLGPMLARLQQPQQQQRQQLTDTARMTGNLRSGSYMNSFNNLLSRQGQQQNDLMSQVLMQVLGPIMQGQLAEQQNLFRPAAAYTDILQALRPDLVRGDLSGGGARATAGGGGGYDPFSGIGVKSNFLSGGGSTGIPGGQYMDGSPIGGGSAMQDVNAGQRIAQPAGTSVPYEYDYGQSGGNSIAYNPFTGSYETTQPTQVDPFQHTYSEWEPNYNFGTLYQGDY